MDKIINFYNDNKELIQLIAIALVWFFTHRQVAIDYAKEKASTFIFTAEKYSESLMLTYGKEKMGFVVSEGYKLLPSWVRMFISMDSFQAEAQKLFDAAKLLADSKTPVTPIVTVATQSTTVNTTVAATPIETGTQTQ